MKVALVMFRADGQRRTFPVVREMTIVGRREDCDLRIPLGDVSRKHCRLIQDGDTLRIEDLGSSNGTYHNGEKVQEATLSAGDAIQIGPVCFVVQIDGVPRDEDIQIAEPEAVPEVGSDDTPAEGFRAVDGAGDVSIDAPVPMGEEGEEPQLHLPPASDSGFDFGLNDDSSTPLSPLPSTEELEREINRKKDRR